MNKFKEDPKWVNDYNSYKPMKIVKRDNNIYECPVEMLEYMLDDSAQTVNFNIHTALNGEIVKIGEIQVGNMRSNDKVGTQGKDFTVWYQDGTKWTINYSWFL